MKGREWLWLALLVAGFGAAWAAGVPEGTLLIAAALLVCPLAMYFGMSSMAQERTVGHSPPGEDALRSGEEQAPLQEARDPSPRRS